MGAGGARPRPAAGVGAAAALLFAARAAGLSWEQLGLSRKNVRAGLVWGGGAVAAVGVVHHWVLDVSIENPALVAAQQTTPVFVETDPATCSAQFDPTGTAKFVSACDIAKRALAVATPGGSGALRHAVANFLEPTQALLGRILAKRTARARPLSG